MRKDFSNLTKKQSLFYTKICWRWVEKTGKEKEDWFKLKGITQKIKNNCFCCNYAHTIQKLDCTVCPIFGCWNGKNCMIQASPFQKYLNATDKHDEESKQQYAKRIADYAEKEWRKLKK